MTDHLMDLPLRLAHALVALAAMLWALGGKPPKGPSAQAVQLELPFMKEDWR